MAKRKQKPKQLTEEEKEIIETCGKYTRDPLSWVLWAFDWGYGELGQYPGPEEWQRDVLSSIRDGLITINEAIQVAVASGHGIGKSALVAWIILWAMSTCEDCKGVVTANTENQLETKTWAELAKWYRLCITKDWFEFKASAIFSADSEHEKTWRIDRVPWSERNTEAFAGLHNQGKRILVVFDEASAIPDVIHEVTEGALTDKDTEIIWCQFGNPTRNTGRFRECFRKFRHRWHRLQIDSRTVSFSNKDQIEKWEKDYGEDSDFFRVRVKGQFPSASSRQFISTDLVERSQAVVLRKNQFEFAPVIIGVDPAWTGDDEFVIYLRQGLYSQLLATYPFNDNDSEMAGFIAHFEDEHKADAVFIDQGYGTGVYSFGKQMGRNWQLIAFASKSPDKGFHLIRSYMWGKTKKWMQEGGSIPDTDQTLYDDLIGPEYHVRDDGSILLESKKDMERRGIPSPNHADALALTFARDVVRKGINPNVNNQATRAPRRANTAQRKGFHRR